MKQLALQQIGRLSVVPFRSCQVNSRGPILRPCMTLHRGFARHSSNRLVAQARKSLLMRELEESRAEMEEQEQDKATPSVSNLEWESPLDIVRYPDPRLRAQNAKITVFDESLKRLADEMFDIMYRDIGVGLAAPQVGVNVRLMVYNPEGERGKGKEYILVNPRIISSGRGMDTMEEGCLSFQDASKDLYIRGDVTRANTVKIKAQDETGAKVSLSLTEFQARIFQHEYDHLQGTLFHDRMNKQEFEKVKPELVFMEQLYRKHHPDVQIQSVNQ